MHSISRLASKLAGPEHLAAAVKVRAAISVYEQSKDLIELGAHIAGTNPVLDKAIRMRPQINAFLRQDTASGFSLDDGLAGLHQLAEQL